MSRFRSQYRLPVALAGCAALATACGGADAPTDRTTAFDSAGVTVIAFDPSGLPTAVSLAAEPTVELGVVQGDAAQEFDGVRSAVLLGDTLIVLANSGSNEIRLFDAAGKHVRTLGGTGDGPGEFQGLATVGGMGGDTLFAYDRWARRITYLTADGTVIRTDPVSTSDVALIGRLGTGEIVPTGFLVGMPRRPAGVYADTAGVTLMGPPGDVSADTILRVLTLEWFSHGDTGPPTPLSWGRMTFLATGDSLIHAAVTDVLELRSYRADGSLVRIIRSTGAPPGVDDASWSALREEWVAGRTRQPEDRAEAERRWSDLPRPARLPAISQMRAGPGVIWLQRYEAVPEGTRTWILIEDGVPTSVIEMPAGMQTLYVDRDNIIVRRTDDLGVEYVALHALERAAG